MAWLSRGRVISTGRGALTCPLYPPGTKHPTQVSWSLDHKSAHAGTYEVRFFDEESYSLLRKVSITWSPVQACRREGIPSCHSHLPRYSPLVLELRATWGLAYRSRKAGRAPSCPLAPPVLVPSVFLPYISLPSSSMTQASGPASLTPPHSAAPLTPAPPLQAQRNNEDISIIPPLFTVSVDHRVSELKRLTWY